MKNLLTLLSQPNFLATRKKNRMTRISARVHELSHSCHMLQAEKRGGMERGETNGYERTYVHLREQYVKVGNCNGGQFALANEQ